MSDNKNTWKQKQKVSPRVKNGISQNAFLRPREATRTSKQSFKQAKKSYKFARKKYKLEQRNYKKTLKNGGKGQGINHVIAKKNYLEAKTDKKVAKRVYRKTKAVDGTRVSVQLKAEAKIKAKQELKYKATNAMREDDTLREGVEQFRKVQQTKQNLRVGFKISKNVGRLGVKSAKGVYGLGNRLFNFSRGRGFQRTPEDLTARKQLMIKMRNFQQRLKAAKAARKAARGLGPIQSIISGKTTVSQGVKLLLKNPVTWSVLGVIIVVVMLSGVASSAQKPAIVQEDVDLTDSWTYMTKLDAENSDTSTAFYSDIDAVMFYMNYRFDDYKLLDYLSPTTIYQNYLTDLWTALNGKAPDYSLKTMEELETKKDSPYYISEEEYEQYQEIKEELGYRTLQGQLSFPYETESLIVTRRFGYERQGEEILLNKGMEVTAAADQEINAPLSGVVSSIPSETSIQIMEGNDARLTIEGVKSSRFKGNEEITTGSLLGNATGDQLIFYYEKYQEEQDEWVYVNPGFYFPSVTYTQTTMLGSADFDPGTDVEGRAKAVYDYLTKMGYTRAGIAAILGNFSVESGINPKRAEGDYLNPPVGASGNSWDDPAWLAMGGMDIYGKYPNILHRGLGLGQWTDTSDGGTRHTLLLDFAKSKNKKWYDLQLQLDFIFHGDTPGARTMADNTAGSKVAATVPELTVYFLNYWEGNPGDKVTERIQAAQNWYNFFADTSADLTGSSQEVFEKYKDKVKPLPTDKETGKGKGWPGNAYWPGNCTWYVYNRMKQLGKSIHPTMGNADQWIGNYVNTPGASLEAMPKRGDAVIFSPGVAGSSALYGHVAFVEYVNGDGTFVISEMNVQGEYSMGWRVLKKQAGMYFMRVK
jgi:surface antigen